MNSFFTPTTLMIIALVIVFIAIITFWRVLTGSSPYKGLYSLVFGIVIGGASIGLFSAFQALEHRAPTAPTPTFTAIHSLEELATALQQAAAAQQPVLLDVTADWCSPCIAYKKQTFPAQKVAQTLQNYTLLEANVTANTAQDLALMQQLKVIGFPTLLFWDKHGTMADHAHITGFMDADAFSTHLQQHALHLATP